jgi:serine/threonine-protein kinase
MTGGLPQELVLRRGDVLGGRYEVEQILGQGGMGVVVAARHRDLQQRVALKFMLPEAAASAEARQRFLREARAAVQLKSQHVARVIDVGTFEHPGGGESPYISMEFLQGRDLDQLVEERGALPVWEAVEYVLQGLEAIGEAHALGIVHRDLKPANLFVTQAADGSPCVKVLDFGISKLTSDSQLGASLTATNAIFGTPHYMSPEQMQSAKHVDARADIWSLGVILYQLLAQRLPFHADSVGGLVAQVTTSPPRPLIELNPHLPPALSGAVMRCLQKEPKDRWPNVQELAVALAPFVPERSQAYGHRVARVMSQASAMRDQVWGEAGPPEGATSISLSRGGTSSGSNTLLIVAAAVLVVLGVVVGFLAGKM